MPGYKLIVKNAKVILKTVTNAVLNINGIKDLLTGTGSVDSNNKIDWTLQEYTNTAANFTSINPVLLLGQKGIETDDLLTAPKFKIGDGVTAWNSLPYFSSGGSGSGVQSVTGANVDNTDPLNPIIQDFIISPSGERRVDVTDFHVELRASELGDVSTVTVLPTSIALDSISVTKNGVEIATVNDLDTKQNKPIIVSTSITAVLDSEYVMNATSTFTDPTPSEGKGFTVFVLNGTATVGGITYSVVGTIIKRFYHSGSWLNEVYFDRTFYDTVLNTKIGIIVKDITTSSALTGTTAITLIKSVLIPANTFTTGDICQIINRAIRSTATGTSSNYIYINTSASLSGATLVGTQSGAVRFYGMERNLYIKSATVSETLDTAASASGDNTTALAQANSNLNINWTVDQYIIHAFSNQAVGNSTVSSGLIVTKF